MPFEVAVVGGTGPQGRGLGYRFARAGHRVVVGSRSAERGAEAAATLAERLGSAARVSGTDNAGAVGQCDVVLVAVPYDGHRELVASLADVLAGRVVVSCVNPLGFDRSGAYGLRVDEGSAAEQAQALVPTARVVGAFHHLSAPTLWGDADLIDHEDVLVCGDDPDAKAVAVELARAVTGRDGIDAGPLRLAAQLETLTAALININKRYKTRSGVRITGLEGH